MIGHNGEPPDCKAVIGSTGIACLGNTNASIYSGNYVLY
ncbi:hypothetical protein AM1_4976 [Acaryochloris marina MBIC11017]|uniref:Uncharacterized protein n=1 Tax=Acaryochloris marina (strain MBIC 11017) TaxID=329726 RepID=B0C5T2_ACAM1|nr:hypothetical protein AM1_4976 [Acaryochloris marina MBIC11017]